MKANPLYAVLQQFGRSPPAEIFRRRRCTEHLRNWCSKILWLLAIAALASCVVIGPMYPPHFVITKNVGNGDLSSVVIDYGKPYLLRDSTPTKPGVMTSNSVGAPVPDRMVVDWRTADGVEHQVVVRMKERVSYAERLRGFELLFYDDRLEVYHLSSLGSNSEFTNRKRIYPD